MSLSSASNQTKTQANLKDFQFYAHKFLEVRNGNLQFFHYKLGLWLQRACLYVLKNYLVCNHQWEFK